MLHPRGPVNMGRWELGKEGGVPVKPPGWEARGLAWAPGQLLACSTLSGLMLG